jgi:ribosomal protein S18 acetylase RimI-like enzyme
VLRRSQLAPGRLEEVARFIAERNCQPAQHIGYLGEDPAAVAAELRELDDDPLFAVAHDGAGEDAVLCGLLCADWDLEIGRVWLHGPWAPNRQLMDLLYRALSAHLPAGADGHELFCDVANTAVVDFADRHGFAPHGWQAILRFTREQLDSLPPVRLPALAPQLHDQFADLHDRAFPGTYAPARALLADPPPILVETDGATLLGYAVLKLRPEYVDAQIEYLAVTESARGRGVGARLVAAALHEAFTDERYPVMDLVVDNPAARRLYERAGFRLLREMRSFRLGEAQAGAGG